MILIIFISECIMYVAYAVHACIHACACMHGCMNIQHMCVHTYMRICTVGNTAQVLKLAALGLPPPPPPHIEELPTPMFTVYRQRASQVHLGKQSAAKIHTLRLTVVFPLPYLINKL